MLNYTIILKITKVPLFDVAESFQTKPNQATTTTSSCNLNPNPYPNPYPNSNPNLTLTKTTDPTQQKIRNNCLCL